MGYKPLDEDRLLALRPILARVQALQPGQTLLLDFESPEATSRTRLDLYAFFFFRNEKPLYRLRTIGPLQLLVSRIDLRVPSVATPEAEGSEGFNKVKDFVCDQLIGLDDEFRVGELLESALSNGSLSPSESRLALAEWKRLLS